jgi:methionine-rich copper-binding protein CopC
MTTRRTLSLIAATALLMIATEANAHAQLVASNPPANATVAAPKTLTLTFNEKLAAAFSGFELATVGGGKAALTTAVAKDGKTLTGTPSAALKPGAYKITWRAATADGHRMTGEVLFKVR